MPGSFIQPETIAILKLIHLAKHELEGKQAFGMENKRVKRTPILDFIVEEIEVGFLVR